MKKNNENGLTAIGAITFFSISVVFSSIVISWMLLNAYGVSVSGVTFPEFSGIVNYDLAHSDVSDNIEMTDNWNYTSGKGKTAETENSYIYFTGAKPNQNGAFVNTYSLINENKKDYSIVLSADSFNTIEVIVEQDGFHIPRNGGILNYIWGDDLYFYPYDGANQAVNVNIKTVYNPNAIFENTEIGNYLDFYFNDVLLFSLDSTYNHESTGLSQLDKKYSGVGSKNNIGLVVNTFSATNDRADNNVLSLLESLQLWAKLLFQLLVWNVNPTYLPWELNILMIKSQVFCIGVGIMFWARGAA